MSEQNIDVQVATNESMTIPNVVNTTPEQTSPLSDINFKDVIPSEYGDKTYWNKIKDWDGFFKSFDNAQQLVGKKMPDTPEDPSGYNFVMPEDLPEGINVNDEILDEFKNFAHDLGLNEEQYQKIMDYELLRQKTGLEQSKEAKEKQEAEAAQAKEQRAEEFEEMVSKEFGEKGEETVKAVSQLMANYAGGDLESLDDNLSNEALMAITKTINGIRNDYIKEGALDSVGSEQSIGHNLDDLKSEWRQRLGNSDIRRNSLHPEHDANEKRITELSNLIYQIEEKAKKR